ncbi:MAG TPA: sulfatase-like hydrolase/transferase [Spirochaetota bacterium]|nr:sulfatase-like hydrolase/transferase [Spirochaetota bacterium]
MSAKPNILFFMSDEHRFDTVGFNGNKTVCTPCLDRLAEDAVVFENTYTPSPICVPGRQCMASGQLPRTCKTEKYGEDLKPGYMTFARRFSQYGYRTIAAGKLHHMGTDQMQGWLERVAGDTHVAPRYIEGMQTDEVDKYKTKSDDPRNLHKTLKWDDSKEILRAGIGYSRHSTSDDLATRGMLDTIYNSYISGHYDNFNPAQPHFLYLGLKNPHYPYMARKELFDYYLPRVKQYQNSEPFDHPFLGQCPFTGSPLVPGEHVPTRCVDRAIAAYYANIENMDMRFEEVIKQLEYAGEDLDNWIIIYASDHGEMLGEHAVWEKQKFFEGSVKVPLFIRWPARFKPARVKENVNLCDLFATLCQLADLPLPSDLDSRSLVPLMQGETGNWSNETVSQFGGRNLMIKQDELKYQYYGEDMPEVLFDLSKDPGETKNFINDPACTAAVKKFRRRRAELAFGPDADPEYKNAGYN